MTHSFQKLTVFTGSTVLCMEEIVSKKTFHGVFCHNPEYLGLFFLKNRLLLNFLNIIFQYCVHHKQSFNLLQYWRDDINLSGRFLTTCTNKTKTIFMTKQANKILFFCNLGGLTLFICLYLASPRPHPSDVYPQCKVNLPAEGLPLSKQSLLCV